jgi:hypothetical protein
VPALGILRGMVYITAATNNTRLYIPVKLGTVWGIVDHVTYLSPHISYVRGFQWMTCRRHDKATIASIGRGGSGAVVAILEGDKFRFNFSIRADKMDQTPCQAQLLQTNGTINLILPPYYKRHSKLPLMEPKEPEHHCAICNGYLADEDYFTTVNDQTVHLNPDDCIAILSKPAGRRAAGK